MPDLPTAAPILDQLVEVDGRQLRVRTTAPGTAGVPVVVLHGIMGHAREWDTLVDLLAPQRPVVAIDQRGHGRSGWADGYTLDVMARDIAGVVETLALGPVHVLGHSMGGMVGLVLAETRPDLVDRLVVVDIGPGSLALPGAVEGLVATLDHVATVRYADVQAAVDEWMAGDPYAREPLMAHYARHNLVPRPDGRLAWRFDGHGLTDFVRTTTPSRLWQAVDAVTAPTLLVRGAASPYLSREHAAEVVARLADGRLVEVADGAHDLGVQQPEAVAAAAGDFLVDARSPSLT